MPRKIIILSLKAEVVRESQTNGNLKRTARKYDVQPCQIREWHKNVQVIERLALLNPKKLSTNKGRKLENAELEDNIHSWVMDQRNTELAVSTIDIIGKAMSIDANFRRGDQGKLMHWVYEFMKRRRLSVDTRTRKSQITAAAMQSVKQDFCRRLISSYNNTIGNPFLLVNMDETAVHLNCSPNRTVHPKGEKTVSIMIGGTSSTRFTLAFSVAMDGSKLPSFAIFKGVPGGRVDKSLADVLPRVVNGCVQRKGGWTIEQWLYGTILFSNRPFLEIMVDLDYFLMILSAIEVLNSLNL